MAAHHSVLVIDVLETASLPEMPEEFEPDENSHQLVKDLYEIWDNLNPRNVLEDWHDAEQIREEVLDLFSHGIVDLKTRAEIESMYWSVCHEINILTKSLKHIPEELMNIDKLLADNSSLNASLYYFPAYEIVNDELRDYRFYNPDMMHPTAQTVEYIWQRVVETCFSDTAKRYLEEWQPLKRAIAHRPFNPDSQEYQQFLQKTQDQLKAFKTKWKVPFCS